MWMARTLLCDFSTRSILRRAGPSRFAHLCPEESSPHGGFKEEFGERRYAELHELAPVRLG
jgi:hypothetical protein